MPEGDTIFRTARALDRALAGKRVIRFEAPRLPHGGPAAGTRVLGVEARGKHLLIHFEDGTVLHTHMRMTGSWHVYRPQDRWRRPSTVTRVVIEVPDAVAVCFAAPLVELLDGGRLLTHPRLSALGPDLCAAEPDLNDAVRRLRLLPAATEIGVALLDQRVAAGIGNVYKSEVLFACRVDPFSEIRDLDEGTLRSLLSTASRLLRANLDHRGPRVTVPGGLAVYGKPGRPCPRCQTSIRARRQGEAARVTYWCSRCQTTPVVAERVARRTEGDPR